MKCKVCGHRANTISAMSAHYRKKHPSHMKRSRAAFYPHKEKVYTDARERIERSLAAFAEEYNRTHS